MNSLSDLVENMKSVGADRLVDLLREVHTGGMRVDWSAPAPLPDAGVAPTRREAPRAERTIQVDRGGSAVAAPQPYDEARRFFVELERKLEKQQTTADTVIDRLRTRDHLVSGQRSVVAPPQQLLSIVALAGTRAGGRIVVVQSLDSPARIELRAGPLRGADGRTIPAAVTLEPGAFEMNPRSRRVVGVTFDLEGCEVADEEHLTATIEATGPRGQSLMKVFVEIEVHAPEGVGRGF